MPNAAFRTHPTQAADAVEDFVVLLDERQDTDGQSRTTSTVTPTGTGMLMVHVIYTGDGLHGNQADSWISGLSLTWTRATSGTRFRVNPGEDAREDTWVATMSSVPSAGALTFDVGSGRSADDAHFVAIQISDNVVDTGTGTDGIIQVNEASVQNGTTQTAATDVQAWTAGSFAFGFGGNDGLNNASIDLDPNMTVIYTTEKSGDEDSSMVFGHHFSGTPDEDATVSWSGNENGYVVIWEVAGA